MERLILTLELPLEQGMTSHRTAVVMRIPWGLTMWWAAMSSGQIWTQCNDTEGFLSLLNFKQY